MACRLRSSLWFLGSFSPLIFKFKGVASADGRDIALTPGFLSELAIMVKILDNGICPLLPYSPDTPSFRDRSCVKEGCALWSYTGNEDEDSKQIWACALRVMAEAFAALSSRIKTLEL